MHMLYALGQHLAVCAIQSKLHGSEHFLASLQMSTPCLLRNALVTSMVSATICGRTIASRSMLARRKSEIEPE